MICATLTPEIQPDCLTGFFDKEKLTKYHTRMLEKSESIINYKIVSADKQRYEQLISV